MAIRMTVVGALATVFAVAGAAQFIQNGPSVAGLLSPDAVPGATLPAQAEAPATITLARAGDETTAPDQPVIVPPLPEEAATPDPLPVPDPLPLDRLEDPDPSSLSLDQPCAVDLTAELRPASIAHLAVTAPCRAGERVTVRHAGLLFSGQIDALGAFAAEVPALLADAAFSVTFPDGRVARTALAVPGAEAIDRVALQFNGPTGLQIHALEFGADYGDPGHVWAEAARDWASAMTMRGGFLTRLGDASLSDAFLAEVYTFPAEVTGRDGVVRLSVEAEVTPENCGRDIAGQTIQAQPDGSLRPVSLTLSMPGCEAVGEFLVLKNLLRDLKIASN